MSLSRARILRVPAVLSISILVIVSSVALILVPPATAAGTAPTPMVARTATAFLDSLGVATHMSQADTPYGQNPTLVATRLRELGIRHVREALPINGDPEALNRLRLLEQTGARFDFIAPRPAPSATSDAARITPFVAEISRSFPASTELIEGPNEYDNKGDPTWPTVLKRYQRALHAAVRADVDPRTSSLPLLAPSLVGARMADTAPLLEGITDVDAGNLHSYPLAAAPEAAALDQRVALTQRYISGPSAPVYVSEAGYHNAVNTTQNGHPPMPESVGASYSPRLFLDNFRKGIARTYAYELVDEGANQSGAPTVPDTGLRYREANFGLFRFDLSYKPAATAVRNLTTLLADAPEPFTPGSLDVAFDNAPSDLRHVLLEKSDGSFYLALWRPSSLWDRTTKTLLAPAPSEVTVRLGRNADLALYRPGTSAAPVTVAEADSLPVGVGAEPVVLRVAATVPPGAPLDVTAEPRDGAASVSWRPVPGADRYTVTSDPAAAPVEVPADPDSSEPPRVTVPGLANGSSYRFQVSAANDFGVGPPSAWTGPVVPSAAPTAPTDVVAVPGRNSVTVGWTAPDSGAAPTAYTVAVSPGGRTIEVPAVDGSAPRTVAVAGLADGVAYTFTVSATNGFGTGPASASSAPVVPGPPGPPTAAAAVPGAASATVSWVPPEGAPAVRYQVTASPGGATATADDPQARSVVVPGLQNGTPYTFTVVATNAAGSSNPSARTTPVVPGPPAAPTAVTAVPGNAAAQVSWTAPAGAPVTGYSVVATPGGARARVEQPADGGAPPSTTATVAGLVNGTSYTFQVVATNAVGSSGPSAPSSAVRPTAPTTVVQENAPAVRIGGWSATAEPGAGGGSVRVSSTPNDTAALSATATSLGVVLRTGPNRGRAGVLVDGALRTTVDLYSPTPGTLTRTFAGLANRSHTVALRVVGTRAAASTGTAVALDGWRIGTTGVDDGDVRTVLSGWRGLAASAASGGTLRLHRSAGQTVTVGFTGTAIEWVGARGPAYGRARIRIDGVAVATVDAYASRQQYATALHRRSVPNGAHTLTVEVLGTRSTAATAADVPVDAFVVTR